MFSSFLILSLVNNLTNIFDLILLLVTSNFMLKFFQTLNEIIKTPILIHIYFAFINSKKAHNAVLLAHKNTAINQSKINVNCSSHFDTKV